MAPATSAAVRCGATCDMRPRPRYSLWVFFNFGFTLGLMQFYRELPLSINSMITTLRGSVLNELVLAAAILSISFLFYSRVCSHFQKKYQNSSMVWPMDRE
jgi:hypothetical protein